MESVYNSIIEALRKQNSKRVLKDFINTVAGMVPDEVVDAAKARIAEISREREEKAAEVGLTPQSMQLLKVILKRASWDFDEDGLGFILIRELPLSAGLRGNLTDLKKKGILKMEMTCDDIYHYNPERDGYWVTLTEKGREVQKALAA